MAANFSRQICTALLFAFSSATFADPDAEAQYKYEAIAMGDSVDRVVSLLGPADSKSESTTLGVTCKRLEFRGYPHTDIEIFACGGHVIQKRLVKKEKQRGLFFDLL